jgi:hypothetical protein
VGVRVGTLVGTIVGNVGNDVVGVRVGDIEYGAMPCHSMCKKVGFVPILILKTTNEIVFRGLAYP